MSVAGVLTRAAAGSRLCALPVRYLPLGSPMRPPKRSYVHVPRVTVAGSGTAVSRTWEPSGYREGVQGWVPGGWYTGYYPHPATLVLPGPNHC